MVAPEREPESPPGADPEIVEAEEEEEEEPESGVAKQSGDGPQTGHESERGEKPEERRGDGLPLQYLGFVPELFWQAWAITSWIYGTVKGWLGPLNGSVDKVQQSAKPYVARAYQSMNSTVNPNALLVSADSKVDGFVKFLDRYLPESVTGACSRGYNNCTRVMARVWQNGLKSSATAYYNDVLPVFEAYGISAYKAAIRIPLMPKIFAIARYLAVTVNKGIMSVKKSGLPFAGYLAPLPVDYFDNLTKSA